MAAQPKRLDSPHAMSAAVHFVAETRLPTLRGTVVVRAYRLSGGVEPVAIVVGNVSQSESVPVYLHYHCFFSEIVGSTSCKCRSKIDDIFDTMTQQDGPSVLIYLQPPGSHEVLLPQVLQQTDSSAHVNGHHITHTQISGPLRISLDNLSESACGILSPMDTTPKDIHFPHNHEIMHTDNQDTCNHQHHHHQLVHFLTDAVVTEILRDVGVSSFTLQNDSKELCENALSLATASGHFASTSEEKKTILFSESTHNTDKGTFLVKLYTNAACGGYQAAVVFGDVAEQQELPLRVHDRCITSEGWDQKNI
eukprot:TRINITY_DN5291_c0_g1_i2.p1 TRINITY_DN5291_c0_g1~~TRINITY_DN5291_c0_g1_i2.p1  ORF type:complete len:308 (+),score=50.67 TRINITY_DN5291_c0_g1_i2:52-975(+)